MRINSASATWLFLLVAAPQVSAQADIIPPGDTNPVLRVEAGGPTSLVNSLAFSPDGRTLYTAGWDKVVRVWRLDAKDEWWRPAPAYRVPLGPGADGKINAIALSADGNWLAVAGSGAVRSRAGFRDVGIVVPSLVMSTAMREDQGVIYVFDVNTRSARVLRGHGGPVFALTFAPRAAGAAKDEPPPLVSAARERQKQGGYGGVVWLWDTAKGTHQAWPGPLPDVGSMGRPGLATWRSAADPKSLQVAAAWEDGTLRAWDVARGKDGVVAQKDAKFNVTVAPLQGAAAPGSPGRLLTGGLRSPQGYLQAWKTTADGSIEPASLIPAANLAPNTAYLPLALALVSSKPGAAPDHAAVALYVQEGEQKQLRLHLLDLDPARFGALKADLPLWQRFRSMPTLAAVPGGRYLAVSDLEDQEGHGILVYVIQDLLTKGDQAQPWRLAGVGETFRNVAFVRGKQGLGLFLDKKAGEIGTPLRPADEHERLVFDFNKPGFTAAAGWKFDAPDLGTWRADRQVAKVGKQEQSTFDIESDGQTRKISLEVGQRVTAFALLSPGQERKEALLAVAVEKFGEPSLLLYDAGSGNLIRQFTGHDDFIRGLAFSKDGKLLASVAEDQTVCLWSLTDLPQLLGKHGLLTGLAVKDHAKDTVEVGRVDKASAAAGKLATGDVIEGIVLGEKLKPAGSARSFYTTIWERKPGETITLQVANKGRVALPVEQAVDERQPLLTLFVARGGKAVPRDWIAWNPQGPYADSGRRAEDHLGWHLNTGKPDAPTSFAKAGEYRAKYFKEGLLGHLVARAALVPALADLKKEEEARLPPDPRVLVRIGDDVLEATRADDKGIIAVQPRQLVLHVHVEDFPAELVKGVEVSIDGKAMQRIESPSESEWSADLPPWQSGEHALRILVRTPGGRRPDYTVGPFKVRYQPPPPDLTTSLPRRQVVKTSDFTVRATAGSEVPGQEMELTVLLNHVIVDRPRGPEINKRVELRRDDNLIEILAVNKKPLSGFEKAETSRVALTVVYDPQAPQIALTEIVPLHGDKEKGTPIVLSPGEPLFVNVPKFRVRGIMQAQEDLANATIDDRELAGFTAGKKTSPVNQEVTLTKPGRQKITFAARTKNTQATQVLEVEYHPQLPSVVFLPPVEGLVFFDEGKGAPEVTLRFQVKSPRDPAPFDQEIQATILINGERQQAPPAVDAKTKELTVKFKPQVRDNVVQVRLAAPLAEPQTSEGIAVQYLRVPYGVEFVSPPAESEKPEVDVTARVQSPLPLLPKDIRATVMDRPIQNVTVEKQDGPTWLVRLKDVSLNGLKGSKSTLRIQAANGDGMGRVPAECSVIYRGPPPKRADVALLAPKGVNVTEPTVTVQFRVSSESRLKRLALVNAVTGGSQEINVTGLPEGPADLKIALRVGAAEDTKAVNLGTIQPNPQGFFESDSGLTLIPGPNSLHIIARNDAGDEQSQSAVVNFFPPPVRVLLDRLEPLEGGQPVDVRTLADGKLSPAAPHGRLLMQGRVVWSKEKDDRLKGVEQVVVRVNGVQQVDPVKLEPPAADKPRERAFQAKVFLSKPEDNRLEVELPRLPQEESDRRVYLASCVKPIPEKRMLHLLIIGISEKDPGRLKDRVLTALGATSIRDREFTLSSFDQGLVYGPLVDDVRPVGQTDVFRQFGNVKKNMDVLARKDWFSHVVMVYYQGSEVVNDKGYFLRTSGPDLDPSLQFYRIPFDSLEKLLTANRGAQILLMDVARETDTTKLLPGMNSTSAVQIFADSHAAVMRYAQMGRVPADQASLIGALEGSLRRASRLSRVEELVAQRFEELRQAQPTSMLYSRFIPPGLGDLVIGPAAKQ